MPNEKQINSRIQHKYDTKARWIEAGEKGFIPKEGELIIYSDENRMKIGDGINQINDLSYTDDNSVLYTKQNVTKEQQTQARANIGAVSLEEVEELLGIEEEFSVSGEVVEFDLDIKEDTELQAISKINRDETWSSSNTLVLHQVNNINFVDFSAWLGGVGTVFEKNGLTATVNANSTVTIRGTNESTSTTPIIQLYRWNSEKVYPAGTYTIPKGFTMVIRDPSGSTIPGYGNLNNTVTITEPFRIIFLRYGVDAGATIDVTLPLGLFRGNSVPEVGYEYSGILHTVTFDAPVYNGEFNWSTGELKDIDGNTVGYYDAPKIKKLPGTNYFWTGFGENIISNVSNSNLEKTVIALNKAAPEETVPSICDFVLTPNTKNYSICANGDSRLFFHPEGNLFYGMEVPLITTRGNLVVTNSTGLDECKLTVPELINYKNITDTMTANNIIKRWSNRFYITRDPDFTETVDDGSGNTISNPNTIATWVFSKKEFEKYGVPVEATNIPIVSPVFSTVTNDELTSITRTSGGVYLGTFGYDMENDKYIFKCRARQFHAPALYKWTSAYFCYPLKEEISFNNSMISLYLAAGYSVRFEQDNAFDVFWNYALTQTYCPFSYENRQNLWNAKPADATAVAPLIDTIPNVGIFIPRSVEDALYEAGHIAKRLNYKTEQTDNYEANSYNWIGAGDGTTDYTDKIQSKLTEIHNTTNGGTINLGPGTYPISNSLIVYGNTQIIGNGHTIIEQRADNTHAVIWSGSNIHMRDLTIKLTGACTELTACIYINSDNVGVNRDERYPENTYVQLCSTRNMTLKGTYGFSYAEGYPYLSDENLAYRGTGILCDSMYFNFYDCDGLICQHLYAGIYGGSGANIYRIYAVDDKYAVRGGGGNNIYDITGHTLYGYDRDGQRIYGTEYVFYGEGATTNKIMVGFYDPQYSKGIFYFDGGSSSNLYSCMEEHGGQISGISTFWESGFVICRDYGRGNADIQPYKEKFVGVGSVLYGISGLPEWNTQFNPSIHNALSGAGIWGTITSNKEWRSNGIDLSDVCRYPKDTLKTFHGLASAICEAPPSEDSPIEIIIDISDRPVTNYKGFWIQFDHRYVAEDYTISFDTNNNGVFNSLARTIVGNNESVSYSFNYQEPSRTIYRIKISITKALQIPNFKYRDAAYTEYTIDYNPDGLIGIVNIGMPSNEAYGRAFLGECGGGLYGNVDMHQNTLKNLPEPADDGDAVSKAYVDTAIANVPGGIQEIIAPANSPIKVSVATNGQVIIDWNYDTEVILDCGTSPNEQGLDESN